MGPDLFGIIWATGFLFVVVGTFALLDRLICGAWSALLGSPGVGLVAGMAAWGKADAPEREHRPSSSGGQPPESPDPVEAERVRTPRLAPPRGRALSAAF